ncbi:hypothetical protein GGI18_003267, partial [Coemansia linderi]
MAISESIQKMPLAGKVCCCLAAFQALAVIGLETSILVIVLQEMGNVFSSWSSDKGVAIYFLLLVIASLFGLFLMVGGVVNGDTIQIIGFCLFNLFAMTLAIFRFYQVRTWIQADYKVGYLVYPMVKNIMVASIGVMAGMTAVFGVVAYLLYIA